MRLVPCPQVASALLVAGVLLVAGCSSTTPGSVVCSSTEGCPYDSVCTDGRCVSCSPECQSEETCLRGRCLPRNCGDLACGSHQACIGGTCADPQCLEVTCARGESCARGQCYPTSCADFPCNENQVCINDECVFTSCAGVTCLEGQTCVDGLCREQSCGETRCADGAVCVEGTCQSVACVGTTCPEGTACARGHCVAQTCGGTLCAEGEVCLRGTCTEAACLDLNCGPEQRCVNGACEGCGGNETSCTDGQDDDCDGLIDCEDSDCEAKSCNDEDACTTGEVCSAGTCSGGGAVTCEGPADGCHESSGTCDPTTGQCVYPPKPALTTCDDNNPCTFEDVCDDNGTCVGSYTMACNTPPGSCRNAEGTCNPATGECEYALSPVGTTCENPSACFSGGSCDAQGKCTGGTANTCAPSTNPCYEPAGVCDPQRGCVYTPKVAGSSCSDGNACTVGDTCDGAGACRSGSTKTCSQTSNQCLSSLGTCNRTTGACTYAPKASGTGCSDGDGCTVSDKCDGSGHCIAGRVCPSRGNPCETGVCTGNYCSYPNKANGTRCGTVPAQRCCGGTCVDISKNSKHCGGCNTACDTGQCESVSATSGCNPSPASTTGRCRCYASNAQCPRGQVCRTLSPYINRCTPNSGSNCAGRYVDVVSCPNYCTY